MTRTQATGAILVVAALTMAWFARDRLIIGLAVYFGALVVLTMTVLAVDGALPLEERPSLA